MFWNDIDCDNKTISIKRQMQYRQDLNRSKDEIAMNNGTSSKGNGYWYYKNTKYKSLRTIKINDELANLLSELRSKHYEDIGKKENFPPKSVYVDEYPEGGDNFVESRILEKRSGVIVHPVFTKPNGEMYTPNICQHVCSIIHRKVTKDFDMHSLRKTHSTALQNQGLDIRYIAKRLGHKNIKVTTEVYYELTNQVIDQQDNMLDSFFNKIAENKGLLENKEKFLLSDYVDLDTAVEEELNEEDSFKW